MAKKNVAVKIETALHAQVKSAAPLRGVNVEVAYDQALRNWLENSGHTNEKQLDYREIKAYDLSHVVRATEKASVASKILVEAMSELRAATDEAQRIATTESSVEQNNRNIAEEVEAGFRVADRIEAEHRQNESTERRDRKRPRKKLSGGAA